MSIPTIEYKSFLIRLWCEANLRAFPEEWRGEVEHIQSGRRWSFSTLDELLDFLRRQTKDLGAQ